MTTFTTTLDQIQSLYVGYFGRAADPAGANYWIGALNSGSVTLALAAASFAVQPEATARYPYLAYPSLADPGEFVDQVYRNLFNHTADAAGRAYWVSWLEAAAGSPQAVGQFILNVISGATGADNAAIRNKVEVARDFTTKAANLGVSWIASTQGQSSLELSLVTDQPETVAAAKEATDVYFASAPGPQQTFTLGIDSLQSSAARANFNAPLLFNPATGTLVQSLQSGDAAFDTGPAGTLTAILNSGANTPLVTLRGIPAATVTSLAGGSGFSGSITGLTTLTNSASTGSLSLGIAGQGLVTALATVNIAHSGVGAGPNTQAVIAAQALEGTSDTVTLSVTGALGASTPGGGAAQVVLMSDGVAGTADAPMNAYETMTIGSSGPAFLQLSNAASGALSTSTLILQGAGAVQLSAGNVADFSRLARIDASGTTGGVTITGLTDVFDWSGAPFNAGAAGLLAANASLTSFTGGSGDDRLDISFMTAAQVGAFTTLDGGAGRDMLVVGAGVPSAGTGVPGTGFEIIGVAEGLVGTVNVGKLGAGVDTVRLLGIVGDDVAFANAPATFTFLADGYVFGANVTIDGPGGSADVLNIVDRLAIGDLVVNGYETVDILAKAEELIFSIRAVASAGLATTLNIVNDNSSCGCFFDVETGAIDIGVGTLNISGSGTGGVAIHDLVTAATLNASALNVTADPDVRGVGMEVGAAGSIDILGSNGSDFLVGSAAADVIDGGPGNDIIWNANAAAVAAGDRLTGGGGADFFLLINNAASAPVLTAYGNAPTVTDFTAGPAAFEGDTFFLSPDGSDYGVPALQASVAFPGEIAVQGTASSGTAAILDATSEIVKLTQGTATAGLTLQQAFDAAIGSATITGATASGAYFFTMYDATNGRMAIGIVDATNGTNTVIEAGDAVVLVGTATMSAAAYTSINSIQFAFDIPF